MTDVIIPHDTPQPPGFEPLKTVNLITDKARAAGRAPDFSRRIGQGLPHPPPT